MVQGPVYPVVLVILDGWGYRDSRDGNAILMAKTPVMDSLSAAYPSTLIRTSAKDVGLPEGQMGNSEVGHVNIGAGRIVKQELVRISDVIEEGTLGENLALGKLFGEIRSLSGKLHIVGLCSEGGVHSHLKHLFGLLDVAVREDISQVCIHAITDGRDTYPTDGVKAIGKIQNYIDEVGIGRICTLSGRYYAMDRDKRWDRVKEVYNLMTTDGPGGDRTAVEVLQASYDEGVTDEFVLPTRLAPGAVEPGDGLVFFNFRPDRARQLSQAFVDPEFTGFARQMIDPLTFVTFTQYDPSIAALVAFEPQNLNNILGEIIAQHGLRQLRIAETEKYAHVTYFFNGGLEEPLPGEDRHLVQSPMVATYDQAPEMSAVEVTDEVCEALEKQIYSLVVINYANPDMVGHTGIEAAAVTAIETVDKCLGRLVETVNKLGGTAMVTADHGNAELMRDEVGNPWTAHTTNPVPLILIEGEGLKIPGHGNQVELRTDGRLADIAPTILDILNLPQPPEMTGKTMLRVPAYQVRQNRSPVGLYR